MKKILVMSAFVAISAAFVACSSNDDLVQAPTAPEETVDEGTPLTIKVTDATRGTDWTATSLPSFSLYSVANGGTTRWLGTYENGSSSGVVFDNTSDGGTGYTGEFTNGSNLLWEDGTWDFYAISDATFYEESDGDVGTQDAEHLDAATDRNFTYVVPTNYNDQKDLLVAAAIGKKSTDNGGVVSLPFQHALAQIGQITLKFDATGNTESNASKVFIIKSITIHGIKSTGKYTFPATWTANAEQYNLNNKGTWTTVDGSESEYHVELPQFELDGNNNYKIFDENVDDVDDPTPTEFTVNNLATETARYQYPDPSDPTKTIKVPNYFRCPAAGKKLSYVLPLAKKTGTEGNVQYNYNPTAPNYDIDGGLYIIPQVLSKTVFTKNNGDVLLDQTSGVYAEIHGVIFNETSDVPGGPYRNGDPSDADYNDFTYTDEFWGGGNWDSLDPLNNARLTQCLNHAANLCTFQIPLTKTTKQLEAGKVYNLTFDLSQAVSEDFPDGVFSGVVIMDN